MVRKGTEKRLPPAHPPAAAGHARPTFDAALCTKADGHEKFKWGGWGRQEKEDDKEVREAAAVSQARRAACTGWGICGGRWMLATRNWPRRPTWLTVDRRPPPQRRWRTAGS
jgi:hypothetical protein